MKLNGMELMKDTASLSNALMNSGNRKVDVGTGIAVLMWTDRTLLQVTAVKDDRTFTARGVETKMKNWADGYRYPVTDEAGNWVLTGPEHVFHWSRRGHGFWEQDGRRVNICIGVDTGYRDPSF